MSESITLLDQLKSAVSQFYDENSYLLDGQHNSERTCAFHIAKYLKTSKDTQIDVESHKRIGIDGKHYNKHIHALKNKRYVEPDIIIHVPDDIFSNEMVVEIKGWWNSKPISWQDDDLKLRGFTNSENGDELPFNYKIGVFVLLGKRAAIYTIYKNGQIIDGICPMELYKQRRTIWSGW